ncbi:MAG TPA: asparagine synthase (glutamine-hydrolyzing) [Steroidobacteraceae bacterium]|jgi:asparagine synthase (glutamine-hydrolysing)
MCGIVGIAGAGTAAGLDDVRRMAGAIRHRGPDDEGFLQSEGVILGMRRLSIIDLAGGHQPIANEDETVWVVCNGEIYNYRELRAGLERQGHRFRTHSDVEVIVHLYEEHGLDFVTRIGGMFAIALWDARLRRLVLVRDRFGQKPLYVAQHGGGLAFASEVKALLRLPGFRAQLDPGALAEYLAMGYATAPRTAFRGVSKLPPGSRLVHDAAGTRVERWWNLPERVRDGIDAEAWVEEVRRELRRAVAGHMVADVPIGAFLSGGIDSSAVVALMAEQSSQPVNTYSIGYAGPGAASYYNELSYAGAVARRYRTNHHEIPVAPDVIRLLPKLIWHVEEPISDSAMVTTWLVSELAAGSVKVILSGVGGDELFAGYTRYLGEHYGRRYRRIPAWLRRGLLAPLARRLPSGRQNRAMDLARYARRFIQAGELDWRGQYRHYLEICTPQAVAELTGAAAATTGFDRVLAEENADDALLRVLRVDARTQLPEDLLLLTDKVTMAASIECRVPFLDHGLAELAARIPEAVKMQGGDLKGLLRRALTGILPREILERGKRGFGAPMGAWLKSELRPLRDALLSRESVESRGLLRYDAVRALSAAHDAHREDYSDLLLVLVNLELWCRLFVDGRTESELADELRELARAA